MTSPVWLTEGLPCQDWGNAFGSWPSLYFLYFNQICNCISLLRPSAASVQNLLQHLNVISIIQWRYVVVYGFNILVPLLTHLFLNIGCFHFCSHIGSTVTYVEKKESKLQYDVDTGALRKKCRRRQLLGPGGGCSAR